MAGMEAITMLDRVDELLSQCDRLSFSATVARHLVHRRAVSEVLLTDWCRTGADAFVCAAQWSRSHSFYRVRNGRHDTLLLAETIRQVGLLLCHDAYQVPPEHKFLMDRMTYDADLDGLTAGAAPAEIVLVVRAQELRRHTQSASALRLDVEFLRDEAPIGRGTGWVRCIEPLLYKRIRSPQCPPATSWQQRPPPVAPVEVGLVEADDVVLGQCWQPGEWPLRILTEHPVLFDHPLDHVPGMLGLEGIRQASRAILGWPNAQLTTCDITFSRFIELGEPSSVRATVRQRSAASASVLMVLAQAGHAAAQGTVTITNISRDSTTLNVPSCPTGRDSSA
ncbi:MAG: ScbA/BarX family gamma-butyrolactone biosynthesis protein [Pseudonocardiaceae bacterium]